MSQFIGSFTDISPLTEIPIYSCPSFDSTIPLTRRIKWRTHPSEKRSLGGERVYRTWNLGPSLLVPVWPINWTTRRHLVWPFSYVDDNVSGSPTLRHKVTRVLRVKDVRDWLTVYSSQRVGPLVYLITTLRSSVVFCFVWFVSLKWFSCSSHPMEYFQVNRNSRNLCLSRHTSRSKTLNDR